MAKMTKIQSGSYLVENLFVKLTKYAMASACAQTRGVYIYQCLDSLHLDKNMQLHTQFVITTLTELQSQCIAIALQVQGQINLHMQSDNLATH